MRPEPKPYPLEVNNLTVSINRRRLLEDVSFIIEEQQSLALLGLNGAGKSTLLKTVMGLLPDYKGQCRLYGKAPADCNSRKNVAFLPERPVLPQQMTGHACLSLVHRLQHKEFSHTALEYYAHQLNFETAWLKTRLNTYSKGMLQKLSLLSVFLVKPRLIILDEVMSGLDFTTRQQVRQLLKIYRQEGGTLLFSTHLIEDIQAFATHAVLLKEGKIQFHETKEGFEKHCERDLPACKTGN